MTQATIGDRQILCDGADRLGVLPGQLDATAPELGGCGRGMWTRFLKGLQAPSD